MISNSLDFNEVKEMHDTIGLELTSAEFSEITKNYCSTAKGLTLKGFREWFKDTTKSHGEDKMLGYLEKLGYDGELYPVFSRSFILSVHSDQPLTLEVGDAIGTNL